MLKQHFELFVSDFDPGVPFREETSKLYLKFDHITEGQTCCEINHGSRIGTESVMGPHKQLLKRSLLSKS